MKKIILVAFIAFGAITASAQQREKGTIELTPQIGFAISDFHGNDLANDSQTAVSSLNIGVGADYFLNNRWSIHSGLFLNSMGSDVADKIQGLTYLTLPVNASWHFGSDRRWNLNFGPSVGLLTFAEYGNTGNKDSFNKVQVGLNAGIGYKIKVTTKFSILVDYQAMYGLSNTYKDTDIKNISGSLNVGGVFKL